MQDIISAGDEIEGDGRPMMKTNTGEKSAAADAVESLRRELAQCRRQLEECRQCAELMGGLYANVADAVFVAEPDGKIIEVNSAACAILGYSRQELLAMHPWDFVTSASRKEILHLIQNMRPGAPLTIQHTYRSKSGEQMIMDLRLTRYELAGRDLIIVSCRNVTEQTRLEEKLRRSEKNLAEGQRLTKTGSWILDFLTGNTDWSVETCRIFGFPDPPPSPHYSQFRARVCLEDREGVDRGLLESYETGEPRPLKYVFVLPDGTRKNIETISQPFKDEAGNLKLMGTVMDVTERVKAQEALQRSEDNLRLAIDTIPGLVWTSLPDGHIEYLNKRWLEYTGLKMEEATGWGWQVAILQSGRKSPARMPNRQVPGSVSTVNGGAANRKPGAQRLSVLRTTLTGTDEPYNGQGDSRHNAVIIRLR